MRRRVLVSASILAAVGAPVVAACSRSSKKAAGTVASGSMSGARGGKTPADPAQWQKLDGRVMGQRVAVEISPLVRFEGKGMLLAIKETRAAGDAAVKDVKDTTSYSEADEKNSFSPGPYTGTSNSKRGLLLLDPEKMTVLGSLGTKRAEGAGGTDSGLQPGDSDTSYVVFSPVEGDQITVFVPQCGVATVGIIDKHQAAKAGFDQKVLTEAERATPDPSRAAATGDTGPVPIERYSRSFDGSTSTLKSNQKVTVTLNSDVTFASDSADLAAAAEAQLQTVAGQISQYPDGGTLTIVGHTDDVQDDAYNQALSEKRANAVKTRLGQLTSLDKWNLSVAGKGESEPRVSGTTDEARAANRRVEITLTPTGGTGSSTKRGGLGNGTGSATPSAQASSGGASLPEAKGPVGKGAEGVTVKRSDGSGQLTISLDHVTRAGGYLLGEVKVVAVDGDTSASDWFHDIDSGGIFSNSRNEDSASVQYTLSHACDGLAVVAGDMQVLPADYVPGGKDTHWPLADFNLAEKLQAGTAMTIAVVWPDPGGDTITVDHQSIKKGNGSYAYRLTDIPVKDS